MEESLLYIYIWRYKTVRTFEFAVCATVCKTVRPMLSDRCPVLSVCDVRALWPNGWTDQDETWHAGRPRSWPHFVRLGPSSPSPKGAQPPIQYDFNLGKRFCIST